MLRLGCCPGAAACRPVCAALSLFCRSATSVRISLISSACCACSCSVSQVDEDRCLYIGNLPHKPPTTTEDIRAFFENDSALSAAAVPCLAPASPDPRPLLSVARCRAEGIITVRIPQKANAKAAAYAFVYFQSSRAMRVRMQPQRSVWREPCRPESGP